ncbi:hypothetical protein HanPSC8_Chr03g0090511 [Helianthus annuus]|nr:hypothetical protein HanPSC8_Chr03g0090511 [Helianthus annuus]
MENMINKHKGTTTRAATLRKSSFSFEITLILDQSPLYLYPASMNPSPRTATTAWETIFNGVLGVDF